MTTEFKSPAASLNPSNHPPHRDGRPPFWTGEETNEAPDKPGDPTYGRTRVLQLARLEAVPRPPSSVQTPARVLYAPAGSGKSSALLETLKTSGAPSKTVADRVAPPVIRKRAKPREHVVIHQRWEGYVEAVTGSGFGALLISLAEGSRDDERTEIDFDEVSAFDRPLIVPGAVFYWSLGYRVRPSGQREGLSVIRFRRLPTWTADELRVAARAAGEAMDLFGWSSVQRQQGDEDRVR